MKDKKNLTVSILVFCVIVSGLMGMRFANRVTDEIAIQQTMEKTQAQWAGVVLKTNDHFLWGDPMNVTYEINVNGQEKRIVLCSSTIFSPPECIVFPGIEPVDSTLGVQGVDMKLLLIEDPR